MDGSVRNYDIRMGQFTIDEVGEAIQSMALSNSNKACIVSTLDSRISLMDRNTGEKVMQYQGHSVNNHRIGCQFSVDDDYILTGSADGKLYIYEIMKEKPIGVIDVSSKVLSSIDVSPKGFIAGDHDGKIYFWGK